MATVIAIVAILAAISIPLYMNYVKKQHIRDAEAVLQQFNILLPEEVAKSGYVCSECNASGTYTYDTKSDIQAQFPKFEYRESTPYTYSIEFVITCTTGRCDGTATCTATPKSNGTMAGSDDVVLTINSF